MNVKLFIAVMLITLLSACAVRPAWDETSAIVLPKEAVNLLSPSSTQVYNDQSTHSILALSAGGSDGAFGAGVLSGWEQSGTRPKFDVVTGVSTGSLLAVLAFLGPEYDELAKKLYTTQTNDSIFKFRGLKGILGDSLYDNTPFQKQIEKHITPSLLAKVASEHDKGRRLYVGTTNIDAGEFVIWDMGKIAKGGRKDPLAHFRSVLRASASVPGFFPPVYIKPNDSVKERQAHVDGGVKDPILFEEFMANPNAKKNELYMIVNGSTSVLSKNQLVNPNLASIAQKTIFELMREIQGDTIFKQYVSAENAGVDFHLTSIPNEIPVSDKTLDFDPVRMQVLYKAGFEIGQKGDNAWNTSPPTISGEPTSEDKLAKIR